MRARRGAGREVAVPVRGEVLGPQGGKSGIEFPAGVIARPIPYVPPSQQEVRIVVEQASAPVEVEAPKVSQVVPWALIAVALCIMLFALYAAWHTMTGPDIKPVRSQQSIDLVSPSR